MKSLLIAILFISISSLSMAQTATFVSNEEFNQSKTEENAALNAAIVSIKHTKTAEQQLKAYLSNNLVYTATLKNYCIEGEAILLVNLDEEGKVLESTFKNKVHPEVAKVILETIGKAKNIRIKNNDYKGKQQIKIPITFSLH